MEVKSGKTAKITGFLFFLFFAGNIFLFAGGAKDEVIKTGITGQILKEHWKTGTKDEREGIYIQYNGNKPYLLGILKYKTMIILNPSLRESIYMYILYNGIKPYLSDILDIFILYPSLDEDNDELDDYYIGIYLYGPGGGWQEGDIQALFLPYGETQREFVVSWNASSGSTKSNNNVRASFYDDDCSFKLTFPGFFGGRADRYERIFPYSRDFARETGSTGTGFLLNREGYVVTNFHVIEGTKHIMVRGINGDFEKAYPFTAVLTDTENDIAILKPEISFLRLNNPSYGFTDAEIPVGSSVFALGYPMRASMGDEIKLTNGIISALSGFQGNPSEYQTTASVSPGNSGGPLFNEQGNVIGINSAYHRMANNAYYAIKIRHVLELIKNSELKINTPSNRGTIWSRNLVENVAAVKNFVYMIEAY
jgi:S1-C subfamily serine protease